MRLDRSIASIALAGAVGICGTAGARPIDHVMKADVLVRVAADGRGDTAVESPRAAVNSAFLDRGSRPDRNVGQERHFAPPIRNDIQMRVSLGDGRESAGRGGLAVKSKDVTPAQEVKGFARPTVLPVPLKTEILMQVSSGGEAGFSTDDKSVDDPKLARENAATDDKTHRNPKVYPGRHENPPTLPEMFMSVHKRPSAHGDDPGGKDAP